MENNDKILKDVEAMIETAINKLREETISFRRFVPTDSVKDQYSPITGASQRIGFYGAQRIAKQTVTGSRGSNAALASLLTKLALLGLITDGSS